jgi:hypothetical protein
MMTRDERQRFIEATLRKHSYPVRKAFVETIIERWDDEVGETWQAGVNAGQESVSTVWIN